MDSHFYEGWMGRWVGGNVDEGEECCRVTCHKQWVKEEGRIVRCSLSLSLSLPFLLSEVDNGIIVRKLALPKCVCIYILALVAKLCLTLATPQTITHQAPLSMRFPRQDTGVGCQFLLQGIFLTQGLNPHLLQCRWFPALQVDSLPTKPPGSHTGFTIYYISD